MTYTAIAKKYCNDILSGKIPSGNLVKLACKRHLDDITKQDSSDFPYRFDMKKANRACEFFEQLGHVKGKWTGGMLKLEHWQVFIVCSMFGWLKKKDSMRRFNVAYIEVPRKNGKSLLGAATGLYMLCADGEQGAEIYSGATTEKQALEVFRPAWQMANGNEDFRDHFGVSLTGTATNPTSIYRVSDLSRFQPLVGNPGDGASPHCAIIDEYHEHRTPDQYDTMDTGMGAREQPLIFVITTAGTDTSSPCYDMHLRAMKILNGTLQDDSLFTVIYGIDPEDKWDNFEVWKKANPNYGVSINEDYLKRKYTETMTNVSKQNINLCKHLNQWMNAGVAWMNMVKWAACADPTLKIEDFRGKPCYAALDLASKIDICALILLFEFEQGFAAFAKYYLPEETVNLAGNEHYVKWVKEGRIVQTSGARTDFKFIEDDLKVINAEHPILELAFDPREATYLINNVMEWIGFLSDGKTSRCIEINQGPAMMSEPMKELEALIYSQRIWFDGDPVLTWMMGNVIKKQGRNSGPVKYYYPTKEKNEYKIDGAVALIMAIARAMLKTEQRSGYENPEAEIITF